MTASVPVRLRVPSIDVDSGLTALGLQADGTLQVPVAGFPAGWYTGGPTPGEIGPAVLAGHVDWAGKPGVFARLQNVTVGAAITVDRADLSTVRFTVSQVQRLPKGAFPTDAVYGDLDHPGLRLVTCGGSFDRDTHHYRDNIVVFANLAAA